MNIFIYPILFILFILTQRGKVENSKIVVSDQWLKDIFISL